VASSPHEDSAADVLIRVQGVPAGARSSFLGLLGGRELRRFSKFTLVGGLSFAVNLGVLFAGTELLGLHYILSMLLSGIVVNLLSFALNRQWTFGVTETSVGRDALRYLAANLLSMLAAMASMAVLVDLVHVQYLLANAIVALVFLLANFFMHGQWTFGRSARRREPSPRV